MEFALVIVNTGMLSSKAMREQRIWFLENLCYMAEQMGEDQVRPTFLGSFYSLYLEHRANDDLNGSIKTLQSGLRFAEKHGLEARELQFAMDTFTKDPSNRTEACLFAIERKLWWSKCDPSGVVSVGISNAGCLVIICEHFSSIPHQIPEPLKIADFEIPIQFEVQVPNFPLSGHAHQNQQSNGNNVIGLY